MRLPAGAIVPALATPAREWAPRLVLCRRWRFCRCAATHSAPACWRTSSRFIGQLRSSLWHAACYGVIRLRLFVILKSGVPDEPQVEFELDVCSGVARCCRHGTAGCGGIAFGRL